MRPEDIKILLVDDERGDIVALLAYHLHREGYQISYAGNGEDALQKARQEVPELLLLDLVLPGREGIEICRQLREDEKLRNTLIVFLTDSDHPESVMAGYQAGADDYITKPIKPEVLVSKVKNLLRGVHIELDPQPVLHFEDLLIDKTRKQVLLNKHQIKLSKKEFALLSLLASQPHKVFSREEILESLWKGPKPKLRKVDKYVVRVQKKIGIQRIEAVTEVGYKFKG